MILRPVCAVLCLFFCSLFNVVVNAQPSGSDVLQGMKWRMIGPFRAGRVNAVSGVVGQPYTFYFGSVGGGVWKTMNAGRTWNPIFDSASSASIGASFSYFGYFS